MTLTFFKINWWILVANCWKKKQRKSRTRLPPKPRGRSCDRRVTDPIPCCLCSPRNPVPANKAIRGGWYWWPSGIVETVERMSNPKLLLSRSRTHFPNWGKGEHPAFVYHLWNARNSIFRNLPQLFPFLHLGMNLKIEGAMMHKLRKIENITPHEQYYGYWSKLSFLIDSVIRRKKCEDSQNPHTCIDLR